MSSRVEKSRAEITKIHSYRNTVHVCRMATTTRNDTLDKIVCHRRVRACSSQNRTYLQKKNESYKHWCRTFAMGYCWSGVDWRRMLWLRMNLNNFSSAIFFISSFGSDFLLQPNRMHTLKYLPKHLRATIAAVLMAMASRASARRRKNARRCNQHTIDRLP